LPARTSNIIIAGSADSAAKSIQDDFGKAVVKVHGIFGGIGSVPKKISGTPRFAEAASAAAATGTTFIELCRTGTPEAVAAAHNSNPDITATLLEAGANVHERNRSGRTALMEARENENPRARKAIVKLLKRAEAEEQPFYGSKDEKGR